MTWRFIMSRQFSNDINFGGHGNVDDVRSLFEQASKTLFEEVMPQAPKSGTKSDGSPESSLDVLNMVQTGKQTDQFVFLDDAKGTTYESVEPYKHLVKQLGDRSFRERTKASSELEKLGIPAVPHLVEALGNKDLEVARGAERSIGEILKKCPSAELLEFRDAQHCRTFLEKGLGRQLTPLEQTLMQKQLLKSVNNELFGRLNFQPWQSALVYLTGKTDRVTGESIQQLDKIGTPDGHAKVTQRIKEISDILNSKHLTQQESEDMAAQLSVLSQFASPRELKFQRAMGRVRLAEQLDESNPNVQESQAKLLLEARAIGGLGIKEQVDSIAVRKNLDQNATFVEGFKRQGGKVETLKEIRDLGDPSASGTLPGILPGIAIQRRP